MTTHGVRHLHIPLLPRQITLPQALALQGFHTCHFGKWHLAGGAAPSHFVSPYFRPGWSEWRGWENSNRPFATSYHEGNFPLPMRILDRFQTDGLFDWTIEWLQQPERQQRPWFHVMSFEPPHDPNVAPERYMKAYRDREIVFRRNVPEAYRNDDELTRRLRGYYAQIRNLDDNIGRLFQTLESTGLLDQTLIVYLSDHGDMHGSHGKQHKSWPEEESSRIPLIIRYPSTVPQARVCKGLISAVDLMPTVLGLLGFDAPLTCEGTDLSQTVTGQTDEGCEDVLLQFDRNFYVESHEHHYRALRHGPWKYIHYADGKRHLFDLTADPYEMHDLIDYPSQIESVSNLAQRLRAKCASVGDHFFDNRH